MSATDPIADGAALRKALASTPRPPRAERHVGRAHVWLARDAEGQARARTAARRDDHAGWSSSSRAIETARDTQTTSPSLSKYRFSSV